MSEVVCEVQPYVRKKRKRYGKSSKGRAKRRLLLILTVLIFAIVLFFIHLNLNVDPIVRRVSESKVNARVSEIVNTSAATVLAERYEYSDLVVIEKNSDGDIVLIQSDVVLINLIARNFVLDVQRNLNDVLQDGVDVPIGAFSGISVLAGAGIDVRVQTVAMGAVTYDYTTTFQSAGINQTLHRLLINVYTDIEILLPGGRSNIRSTTQIAAAESIIIGKIPQFYLSR